LLLAETEAIMERRMESLDQFRGLCIILMVTVNFLFMVETVPAWLKHAADTGFTLSDSIAPAFLFAIGLTYGASARRRRASGSPGACLGFFVRRWLSLMGIGALLSAGEALFGFKPSAVPWEVLQTIGFSGLLVLPFILLKPWIRLVIGLAILAAYQLCLDAFWLKDVFASTHGGPIGAISWSAMLFIATAMGDFFADEKRRYKLYPILALSLVAGSLALSTVIPISKNRVSSSFVLFSTGIASSAFFIFHLAVDRARLRIPLLSSWGRNPLLLYILHYILLAFVVLPEDPAWYVRAPAWLLIIQLTLLLVSLSAVALFLHRKKIVVSF
jgi:predicted acyltransferase